jgi:putative salt-induced outer membrane protein YdiY
LKILIIIKAIGGQYNIGGLKNGLKLFGTDFSQLTDYRFQGWFAGAGIGYGYSWILGRHWNLEAEVGVGYARAWYDKYPYEKGSQAILTDGTKDYWGITKLAISFVYLF